MRALDHISLITRHLKRRKGRTALTTIGLIVSFASMLLLVSISLGTQRTAQNQFTDLAELRQIVVSPERSAIKRSHESQGTVLNRSAIREIAALPGVQIVAPRQSTLFYQVLRIGKYTTYGQFYGIGVDNLKALGYSPAAGSSELKRSTVVLSQGVLENFFGVPGFHPYQPEDLDGHKINLTLTRQTAEGKTQTKTVRLRIAGVLKDAGENESSSVIFMRLDEVEALNRWVSGKQVDRNREGYSELIVQVEDVSQVKGVVDQLSALGYAVSANLAMAEGISSTYALMQITLGGAGITALLVSIITIINTMTTVILERTREIGLMKALGAGHRDVLGLFLGEAAGIGLLGGGCGALLGGTLGAVLDRLGRAYLIGRGAPPSLSLYLPGWLFIVTVLLAALTGGLAGLYPAWRAARLAPLVALKHRQ